MKNLTKTALLLGTAFSIGLVACTTQNPQMRKEVAQRIAAPAWMVERQLQAGPLSLTVYERMHKRFAPADIYIEGEGAAGYGDKAELGNVTPVNPVALHLSSRDKAENVAYIARPCQFAGAKLNGDDCTAVNWGGNRFSPEIVAAYKTALDEIKRRYDIEGFNLIGYDGGAALAALLAAERDDVLSLRTVAGNLDHKVTSMKTGAPILGNSLNPPDFGTMLADVPQYHFIGEMDKDLPQDSLFSYLESLGSDRCAQYEIIDDANHSEGWVNKWPDLLAKMPECEAAPPPVFEPMEEPPAPIYYPRDFEPEKP